jgi:hypothetical protein
MLNTISNSKSSQNIDPLKKIQKIRFWARKIIPGIPFPAFLELFLDFSNLQ